MNDTKENLDVQIFTINDVLGAIMCMDDQEAKEVLASSFHISLMHGIMNDKEIYDRAIAELEQRVTNNNAAIRGLRQLADILQVPKNFEG